MEGILHLDSSPRAVGKAAVCAEAAVCADGHLVAVLFSAGPAHIVSATSPCSPLEVPDCAAGSALAVSGTSLMVGTIAGGLLHVALGSDRPAPKQLVLPADGGADEGEEISCIAAQEGGGFAVARGRYVFVVGEQGEVRRRIGPAPSRVLQLGWVAGAPGAGSCLVAATAEALHTWTRGGRETGPVLPCPGGGRLSLLAASPRAGFLVAACDGGKVHCWGVDAVLEAAAGGPAAAPISLGSYEAPVTCMAWDAAGRHLATSDGADCTVWDLGTSERALKETDSIMCCGHDPATRIVSLAFQPDGPLLATGSDAGKLVLFDSRAFRRGGVAGPHSSLRLDSASAGGLTMLKWLPGGRLLAGTADGALLYFAARAGEAPAPAGAAGGLGAGIQAGPAVSIVDYVSPPLSPLTPPEAPAPAAAPPVPPVPPAAAPLPRPPAPLRTGPREAAPPPQPPPQGAEGARQSPPRAVPPPPPPQISTRRQHSPRAQGRSPGAARASPPRGGAGGPTAAGGLPTVPSPSLMHHIQSIRERGHAGRGEPQDQLTGWGLGSPGGAAVPWMLAPGQAGFMPMQGMQYPPQYQAAMMEHMSPAQGVPVGLGLGPAQGMGGGGMPMGYAAALPGGGYPHAVPPYQHSPPQPPYLHQAQMHQAQQWAGAAPGYMAYQHAAAPHAAHPPPPARTQQQQLPPLVLHSAGGAPPRGGGGGGPWATSSARNNAGGGGGAPRAVTDREAAEANNGDAAAGGSSSGASPRAPEGGTSSRRSSGSDDAAPGAGRGPRAGGAAPAAPPPGAPPVPGPGDAVDPAATLYIGNLQPTVDEAALAWACAHFGPVSSVHVIRDKATHGSRGYAFVTFAHAAYATVAMQQLDRQQLFGPFGGGRLKVARTNRP